MLARGQSIADYQIVEPLAENRAFQCYLVNLPDKGQGRLFLIAPTQLPDPKSRQQFLERARASQEKSFPGVCRLLDVEIAKDSCFCLYQTPPAQSLAELQEWPVPGRQALELVQKIAAVLITPHRSGLWHGHLSPATIALEKGSPLLVDFALGSLIKLDFQSGADPGYCSPEQVRGESFAGPADIYALGILLYQLLVGKAPFSGPDPFAVAMQHVQGEVPTLPDQLAVCQPLIDGLLKPQPEERLTAEQLVEYIAQLLTIPEMDRLDFNPAEEGNKPDRRTGEPAQPGIEDLGPALEPTLSASEISSRIETRLKERADTFRPSAKQPPEGNGADTARVIPAGKENEQVDQSMKNHYLRQKSGFGRFLLLLALGVAIGGWIFTAFFGTGRQPVPSDRPELLAAIGDQLTMGSKLLGQEDLAGAEKVFSKLVEAYPNHPQPYNNLAAVLAARGDFANARVQLERALATDDNYAVVYRNLGTLYAEMARDSYGKALQLETGGQPIQLEIFTATGAKGQLIEGVASVKPPVLVKGDDAPRQESSAASPAPQTAAGSTPSVPTSIPAANLPTAPVATEQPASSSEIPIKDAETAESFLRRWATAWSAKDVDAYLAFYSAEFTPANGRGREAWVEGRRGRIAGPDTILVSLSNFSLVSQAGGVAQVELTQDYQSDRYADRTRKQFALRQKGVSWEILRERSLGRVP